jgi:DNA-directed RNA polymerase subunit M/transcription elongation factor TFIIS
LESQLTSDIGDWKIESMIRYSCIQCGKSLRASDSIAGRKAKCTRCGSIEEVPPFSTRKSNSKRKQEEADEIIAVDSDSFLDLEELRSLVPTPKESSVISSDQSNVDPSTPQASVPSNESASTYGKVPLSETELDHFRPVFNVVTPAARRSQRIAVAFVLIMIAGLVVFVTSWMFGWFRPPEPEVSGFAQTSEAIQYEKAREELKKAWRVMKIIADGFVAAKGGDLSEFEDLASLASDAEKATLDPSDFQMAEELFQSGNRTAAMTTIAESTRALNELRNRVSKQTKEIRDRTYQ